MTPEQMKEVAGVYAQELRDAGYKSAENRAAQVYNEQMDHVLWMCERIPTMLGVGSVEKAHRWLGFVQGVLWIRGARTIDQMAEQNRMKQRV